MSGGFKPIPRTVERCERYLDRLALVIRRAGRNEAAFLPLVRRLERELAEAKADEAALAGIKARLRERETAPQPSENIGLKRQSHAEKQAPSPL